MIVLPCIYSQFYFFVNGCDDICHRERNECLEFITILQCLHVLECNYLSGKSFSREVNLLLKYENYAMKIFKCSTLLNVRVDI